MHLGDPAAFGFERREHVWTEGSRDVRDDTAGRQMRSFETPHRVGDLSVAHAEQYDVEGRKAHRDPSPKRVNPTKDPLGAERRGECATDLTAANDRNVHA
jgi:hypothetical protein